MKSSSLKMDILMMTAPFRHEPPNGSVPNRELWPDQVHPAGQGHDGGDSDRRGDHQILHFQVVEAAKKFFLCVFLMAVPLRT